MERGSGCKKRRSVSKNLERKGEDKKSKRGQDYRGELDLSQW